MSKLRIRNGPYSGREKTLAQESVTIGRDAEASVQILDRSASRFHAEVFPVGGMYFVRDMDSKNGTFVNDERLTDEELLREGDVIKIGTTELVFESGIALNDDDSSDRIAYHDDASMLSNTLEFRLDDLTDLEDEAQESPDENRSLQILYQVGKLLAQNKENPVPQVLDFLLRAMPADAALIFMREADSGKLVPHTLRTATPNTNPVICRTIIRRTVTDNRAFFTADAQEDERFNRKESVIQQGIRSVVCVPLTIAGQNRGVLYISRNAVDAPFERGDMEVASACAIQLGLAFDVKQLAIDHEAELIDAMAAVIAGVENQHGISGIGERTAATATALGQACELPPTTVRHLRLAGILHHVKALFGEVELEDALTRIEHVGMLEPVLPLIRSIEERVDGSGPLGFIGEQLDAAQQIIGLAATFVRQQRERSDDDVVQVIEDLSASGAFDEDLCGKLRGCHLDGSLYERTSTTRLKTVTNHSE